jgi:hypothetical protein
MLHVHFSKGCLRIPSLRLLTWSSLLSLILLSPSGLAADFLHGPQVQVKPDVQLAFASSERVVQRGQHQANGDCMFPMDHSFAPGDLPKGYRFVSVQRELDPVNCVELVEQGLVAVRDLPQPPLNATAVMDAPLVQAGTRLLRGLRQLADSPTYRAHIQVYYTDAGNPIWENIPALDLFEPSTRQSLGALELIWSPPSFCDPRFSTNGSARSRVFDEFQQPFWTRAQTRSVQTQAPSCNNGQVGRGELRASHTNNTNLFGIYDCSIGNGARVDYQPLVISGRSNGSFSTSGSFYRLTGPFNNCTEHLARIVIIGSGEMSYPDLIFLSIPSI